MQIDTEVDIDTEIDIATEIDIDIGVDTEIEIDIVQGKRQIQRHSQRGGGDTVG